MSGFKRTFSRKNMTFDKNGSDKLLLEDDDSKNKRSRTIGPSIMPGSEDVDSVSSTLWDKKAQPQEETKAGKKLGGPISIPLGFAVYAHNKRNHPNTPLSSFNSPKGGTTGAAWQSFGSIHKSRGDFDTYREQTKRQNEVVLNSNKILRAEHSFESNHNDIIMTDGGSDLTSHPSVGDGGLVTPGPILSMEEALARAFNGRDYAAQLMVPPLKTLKGRSISAGSKLTTLWTENQLNSPLLRLPATVREKIYHIILCGKTIGLSFDSYSKQPTAHAVFKYLSVVFEGEPDLRRSVQARRSFGMTLLTGVCRQLYQDTYTLMYGKNKWWFMKQNFLFNFVVMEQRLNSQQCKAFTQITVNGDLPVPSVLEMLPNLQRVELTLPVSGATGGWYNVVRENGKRPELKRQSRLHDL